MSCCSLLRGDDVIIREVCKDDLKQLLELYPYLDNVNTMPEFDDSLQTLWDKILFDENHHIIVCEVDEKIVSSCVIEIIRNLTCNQRPYAFIENVVTHPDYRNKGYATMCLNYAKDIAQQEKCYKIMLMTGSKRESTLRFYENAGYNRTDKTAFVQWLK